MEKIHVRIMTEDEDGNWGSCDLEARLIGKNYALIVDGFHMFFESVEWEESEYIYRLTGEFKMETEIEDPYILDKMDHISVTELLSFMSKQAV